MTQKITVLNGGKENKKKDNDSFHLNDDLARLSVEGEEYEMESFILSGQGPDGKRLLFTWNCSLDEMISFQKVLERVVDRKVDEAIFD